MLTGAFGLLSLDAKWIAIKEAGIPFILGLIVLISQKTPYPIVKKLLINEQILNIEKINNNLVEKGQSKSFDKRITISTFMLSGSFFLYHQINNVSHRYEVYRYSERKTYLIIAFNIIDGNKTSKPTKTYIKIIYIPSRKIDLFLHLYNKCKKQYS